MTSEEFGSKKELVMHFIQLKKGIFYLVRFSKMSFFRFFDGSLMASFWRLLVWSSTRSTCNRSQTHIIGIVVTFFRICRQSLAIMIYTKYMIIEKQLQKFMVVFSYIVDLIVTELKSHMTCYNSMPLIGWNYSIQTGEQIL